MTAEHQKIALRSLLADDDDEQDELTSTTQVSSVSAVFEALGADATDPGQAVSPFAAYRVLLVAPEATLAAPLQESLESLGLTLEVVDTGHAAREAMDATPPPHAVLLAVGDDAAWATMLLKLLAERGGPCRRLAWVAGSTNTAALLEAGAHDVLEGTAHLPWSLVIPVLSADPALVPAVTPDPVTMLHAAVGLAARLVGRPSVDGTALGALRAELDGQKEAASRADARATEQAKEVARLKAEIASLKEAGRKTAGDLGEALARLKRAAVVLGERDAEIARLKKGSADAEQRAAAVRTVEEMLNLTRTQLDDEKKHRADLEQQLAARTERLAHAEQQVVGLCAETQALQARAADAEQRVLEMRQREEALEKASAAATWLKAFEPAVDGVIEFAQGVMDSGVNVPHLKAHVENLQRLRALLRTLA